MSRIFGGLLDFNNEEQINAMVDTLDNKLAIKLLEFALENCTAHYSLLENHIIYKCLSKLKENENKNQGNHLHNDDNNGDIG